MGRGFTVVALPRDALGAAEIEVYRGRMLLHEASRSHERIRVVPSELRHKMAAVSQSRAGGEPARKFMPSFSHSLEGRPQWVKILSAKLWTLQKIRRVEHLRVGELRAMVCY